MRSPDSSDSDIDLDAEKFDDMRSRRGTIM